MGADAFISGWLAGAAGVVVSHPLDTLRVRVQAAKSSTLRQEAARLLAEDGWRGLWRGIASPILLVGLWKAVMFSAASWTQRMLSSNEGEALAPISHTFAGGYVAGAAGLVVQMPMERVKCVAQARGPQYIASSSTQAEIAQGAPRQQILESHAGTSSRFNGLSTRARATSSQHQFQTEMAVAARIWRTEGLAGLYRGTLINATLCPPAIAVWFGTSEYLLRRADERAVAGANPAAGRKSMAVQLACGGVGGILAWIVNYPSDRAKTAVQVASALRPDASSLELLRPYLREEGLRFFVRGMPATLMRALPQCGVTICVQARAAELFSALRVGAPLTRTRNESSSSRRGDGVAGR